MYILKIASTAIILTILCLVVKQYKPEYAVIMQIGSFGVIAFFIMSSLGELLGMAKDIANISQVNIEFMALLVKALGVAIVTQIATEICNDSSNRTMAFGVELAGRIIILSMCIPMIKAVAEIATQIIKG
ncbi:MAG: hypothetical protein EOM05_05080 [Clostridia bacterium]|nr:hypothetical protein [Clostridia bacterium]